MPRKIEGSVVAIAENGNLISDITADQLRDTPTDERTAVRCDEHYTHGIFNADHKQPDFTLIAVLGNSGNLELEIVGDSARLMLGITIGEKVIVEWE